MVIRKLGRTERGAAAVEFAIVGSLLFMVLFGTIQFGLAYHRYQGLNAAAREGARLGSLSQTTNTQIRNRVAASVSALPTTVFGAACPATLALDAGCVDVYIRPGATTGSCTLAASGCIKETVSTNKPCNVNSGKTVVVLAKYRMDIPIPLWAAPAITVTGVGEFKCE